MEWLNFHHLLLFTTLVREGSLVAAGKALRLSPSTLSAQIRAFEEALGAKLVERQGRRLVPTETGRMVVRYGEEIFGLGRELLDAVRGNTGKTSRLAFFGAARHAWLADDFPRSLDGAPMLLPLEGSTLRRALDVWFSANDIRPRVVAERGQRPPRDDAQDGAGVFAAPAAIERQIAAQYGVPDRARVGGARAPECDLARATDQGPAHPADLHRRARGPRHAAEAASLMRRRISRSARRRRPTPAPRTRRLGSPSRRRAACLRRATRARTVPGCRAATAPDCPA